jgi:predicted enzyme related to lactoylglutathione lyase
LARNAKDGENMKFGYTLLYVEDVEASMNFYANAFGLEKGFLHDSKEYGEMITGSTKLGFVNHQTAGSHGFSYKKLSKNESAPGIEIGFVTDDVEASYKIAVNAGAIPISEPTKKPWGQVVSYVRDCNGLLIEICSAM